MLAEHFIRGAEEAGHNISVFDAAHADIGACQGCDYRGMNGPCRLNDDMDELRDKLLKTDMAVFVTPLYYFGFSAQMKSVIDRFYSFTGRLSGRGLKTALIAAAWNSGNLDIALQDMSVLVTLTANQAYGDIDEAVAKALDDGLSAVEIKEAIYQSAPYCGYTRAINAMDAADEALTALGETLPAESRITSAEEDRYADGLAVQRHIFGPQIGTITDDMTPSQRLQTLYLSGICFGDFYNRAGL